MSVQQTRYHPKDLPANSTVTLYGDQLGGFLCVVGGTISLARVDGSAVFTAFPVTAGQYYSMPFFIGHNGGTVTSAGGAAGCLAVA